MNKIILATGMMVGYAYGMEFFMAWFSGYKYESFAFVNRATGPYFWSYWIMVCCNVISPQFFWFKKARRSIPAMFLVCIFVLSKTLVSCKYVQLAPPPHEMRLIEDFQRVAERC